jgi:hypothetical protein
MQRDVNPCTAVFDAGPETLSPEQNPRIFLPLSVGAIVTLWLKVQAFP